MHTKVDARYREKKKAELQDSLNEEMRKKQDAAARQVKAAVPFGGGAGRRGLLVPNVN